MGETRHTPTQLVAHEQALHSLLDSLLSEAVVPAAETPVMVGQIDALEVPESWLNSRVAPPLTGQRPETSASTAERAGGGDAPVWAGQRFRALVFSIGGQRFAMPLVLMARVALMPERLSRMPAQPDWFVGIARSHGLSVVVAELGGLVDAGFRCMNPRYLLVLGNGSTAVVCDLIEDPLTVESDQVCWRSPSGRRDWMAGVLVEELCMLLDPEAIDIAIRHG